MKRRLETKKVGDAIHPPPKGGGLLALIINSCKVRLDLYFSA